MISQLLIRLGIPTYCFTTFTDLNANKTVKVGDTMPPQVGWVYGLSIECNGVLPRDSSKNLITSADTFNLYLNLKYGSTNYVESLRLCNLQFNSVANPASNQSRFLPINMPMHSDLKESTYENPLAITNATIGLTLWYIDKASYEQLVRTKIFSQNGVPYAG